MSKNGTPEQEKPAEVEASAVNELVMPNFIALGYHEREYIICR